MLATDAAIQKKGRGSGTTATIIRYNNFKWRNGRYNENI